MNSTKVNGDYFLMKIRSTETKSSYKVTGNLNLDVDCQDIYEKLRGITEEGAIIDMYDWELFIELSIFQDPEDAKNGTMFLKIVDGSYHMGYYGLIQLVEGEIDLTAISKGVMSFVDYMNDLMYNPGYEILKKVWGIRRVYAGLATSSILVANFSHNDIKNMKEKFKADE